MLKQTRLIIGAGLFLAVAACDKSTGLPSEITQAEAAELAAAMDAVARLDQSDLGPGASFSLNVGENAGSASASVPVTINNTFSASAPCPQGGQVAISGTVAGTGDDATHSLTLDVNATRVDSNCAFNTRHGVMTLNGNPNLGYEGHLNVVNGALVGLQTQSHTGSFTWARGGFSGTCDVDVASSFDPATHTVTISGTFCGWTVNITRSRTS